MPALIVLIICALNCLSKYEQSIQGMCKFLNEFTSLYNTQDYKSKLLTNSAVYYSDGVSISEVVTDIVQIISIILYQNCENNKISQSLSPSHIYLPLITDSFRTRAPSPIPQYKMYVYTVYY